MTAGIAPKTAIMVAGDSILSTCAIIPGPAVSTMLPDSPTSRQRRCEDRQGLPGAAGAVKYSPKIRTSNNKGRAMRRTILANTVLTAVLVLAAVTAKAAEKCVDPEGAIEKMRPQSVSVDKVTDDDLNRLKDAYADVNGDRRIPASDEALVFHRPDAPTVAWVIAFRDGCAIWQEPMTEDSVRKALDRGPATRSQAKPDTPASKSAN